MRVLGSRMIHVHQENRWPLRALGAGAKRPVEGDLWGDGLSSDSCMRAHPSKRIKPAVAWHSGGRVGIDRTR